MFQQSLFGEQVMSCDPEQVSNLLEERNKIANERER